MAVTIYDGSNFSGTNKTLEAGKYPTIPIGNDKISSVKVAPGFYVKLFIDTGFRGRPLFLFAGEYPNLINRNNAFSSMQILEHDAAIFPTVSFYDHVNFAGFEQRLAATDQKTTFNNPFFNHDVISSVKVPEGVTVTIFEHPDLKGRSLTLDPGEYKDLRIFGFNDVASSLEIKQNNLEVAKIEYIKIDSQEGEPIFIETTAQNASSLDQQANLTLETSYEETFTRSFSNSTLFGLEISTTTNVGVEIGPLSSSVEQTVTSKFENTFTFGKEESNTKSISIGKELNVTIPPGKIAKAFMTLTPQKATIEAIYTLRLKGTNLTTKQNVIIDVDSAAVGTVVIEPFIAIAD